MRVQTSAQALLLCPICATFQIVHASALAGQLAQVAAPISGYLVRASAPAA